MKSCRAGIGAYTFEQLEETVSGFGGCHAGGESRDEATGVGLGSLNSPLAFRATRELLKKTDEKLLGIHPNTLSHQLAQSC